MISLAFSWRGLRRRVILSLCGASNNAPSYRSVRPALHCWQVATSFVLTTRSAAFSFSPARVNSALVRLSVGRETHRTYLSVTSATGKR
jgi:hypothetical protein